MHVSRNYSMVMPYFFESGFAEIFVTLLLLVVGVIPILAFWFLTQSRLITMLPSLIARRWVGRLTDV